MAIIPLPVKFAFTSVNRFALVRRTNILRSRYTGQAQRVVYPYAVWEFDGDLVEYDGAEAAAIRAFFALLEGQRNSFKLPVPGQSAKPWSGLGLATAARSSTMQFTGFYQNINAGDFFTVNDELKIITDPVAVNPGVGTGFVNFKPALRNPVNNGTPLNMNAPYCHMIASDDEVASWGIKPPLRHQLKLSAIEAMDIP